MNNETRLTFGSVASIQFTVWFCDPSLYHSFIIGRCDPSFIHLYASLYFTTHDATTTRHGKQHTHNMLPTHNMLLSPHRSPTIPTCYRIAHHILGCYKNQSKIKY